MGGRNYELFATLSQFCARVSAASARGDNVKLGIQELHPAFSESLSDIQLI